MGYPRDYGPRKCPACLRYFSLPEMVKMGRRYYCRRHAAALRRMLKRRVKPNGNGGLR